ncbi:hypothetical protein [Effusibacillus dendaii]|uniref:hypothetical protein n=1 Tax=Effusibacillus dendaii TaxID=2743772 RepID=UPI00190A6493|nr:hypothetical protein [Effusibacillus dendaii]
MSEEKFWRCTPRKLFALADRHIQANTVSKDKEKPSGEPERLTVQELLSWR